MEAVWIDDEEARKFRDEQARRSGFRDGRFPRVGDESGGRWGGAVSHLKRSFKRAAAVPILSCTKLSVPVLRPGIDRHDRMGGIAIPERQADKTQPAHTPQPRTRPDGLRDGGDVESRPCESSLAAEPARGQSSSKPAIAADQMASLRVTGRSGEPRWQSDVSAAECRVRWAADDLNAGNNQQSGDLAGWAYRKSE
ncbi:hypothetical protein GOBAR_AA04716 [Gossypium barbadense]|uniref:Uncharacterized protein n=1 Tax=Gossypium barbadense TaxID=3634 RepID=A0A2P5YJT4_GOSBA|nr:hypothetical protein GOBAR_AA04716 [Gossypium barbadense]